MAEFQQQRTTEKKPLTSSSQIPTPQGQQIYQLLSNLEVKITGTFRGDKRIVGWYEKVPKASRITTLQPMLSLTCQALGEYCMFFTTQPTDIGKKMYHLNMLKARYFEIQAKLNLLERSGAIATTDAQNAGAIIMTPLIKMINHQLREWNRKAEEQKARMQYPIR